MFDFFKGWRRKLGCITLLMAVVTTGLWIRTALAVDYGGFSYRGRQHVIMSIQGAILWTSIDGPGGYIEWQTTRPDGPDLKGLPLPKYVEVWQQGIPELHPRYWLIMYWWFAVPLTLVSAWLILYRPPPKPKVTSA